MTVLSPKAIRFIGIAMESVNDPTAKAVWATRDHDSAQDLPLPLLRAALVGLSQYEQRLRQELENPAVGEDEASDLSNDLGLITATKNTIEREIKEAA